MCHRDETTHCCTIWAQNFGSNLSQCVSDIWNITHPYDEWACSIEVYAYGLKVLDLAREV